MISKIKDRVAIISVDNFDRISKLYIESDGYPNIIIEDTM